MSLILNKVMSIKTVESFGTVDAKIEEVYGTESAKISFHSFGSKYTRVVPMSWLSIKDTVKADAPKSGKAAVSKFAAGVEVSADIQIDEVMTRKGTILEVGVNHIVVRTGYRVRMIPFDRLKSVEIADKDSSFDTTVPAIAAPAAAPIVRTVAPSRRPAAAPAPAPVAPAAPRRGRA